MAVLLLQQHLLRTQRNQGCCPSRQDERQRHRTVQGQDPCRRHGPFFLLSQKVTKKRKSKFESNEEINRSIDAHQEGVATTFAASKKKKSKPSVPFAAIAGGSDDAIIELDAEKQPTKPTKPAPKNYMQLTLTTNSPNPLAENMLTIAIAELIYCKGLSFSLVDDPLFSRVLRLAKGVPESYKPPTQNDIGGPLLGLSYSKRLESNYKELSTNAEYFGLCLYGDGATVKRMPLVNILASGAHLTTAVLDIVDCTGHLEEGGKKDAVYLADLCFPHMEKLDPNHQFFDLILFDGAANVQKAGRIIEAKYSRATVLHGAEHVVSLFFAYVSKLAEIKVRKDDFPISCK
jgi:hypothetical protein